VGRSSAARSSRTVWLWIEFAAFFVAVPGLLALYPTRWDGHVALWLFSIYSLVVVRKTRGFSWSQLWHGRTWPKRQKQEAIIRFICASAGVILFAWVLVPQRLFMFPIQRPFFWLLVMALYPILSALPQELVLRSYFHRRYGELFPTYAVMIAVNSICFCWIHVMFHNWVSPTLCAIAGALFALSYAQHRSLKWAAFEHAAYGCMVFTVGIGFYFLVGSFRPT
jgi:uncharacterized protein